ncbi:polysaccharide lyase family 14 protein [Phanerochaete carnosa HHB-10118-sp]|uniref:Polysaccharide lyase family 14 protein n=1 Tax=Phanerochaete carnosa (strain HHB-10118-sp) TaxID=650164 RepID=K5WA37_PHACS|nr:polysaccharide lyase family 14 protein [Phanerochaete carnosa HHB-10118-sp]EKM56085.1 polysaccharide lyase family 14 protein [Phanerochaete carnosa HHB-10118-sp]
MSVCDQTYGLSVGRGSFNFTPGGWTHVKQTVWLNTPGQQDGGFVLEVDGREVINRDDVFYRDVASATPNPDDDSGDDGADDPDYDDPDGDDSDGGSEGDSSGGDDGSSGGSGDDMSPPSDAPDTPDVPPTADPSPAPAPEPSPMPAAPQPSPPSQAPPAPPPAQNPGLGGLLGPLSPLLNGLGSTLPLKRQEAVYIPYAFVGLPASAPPGSAPADIASTQTDTSTATTTPATSTQTVYFQTTSTTTTYVVEATSVSNPVQVLSQDPQPIGFSGLFFR